MGQQAAQEPGVGADRPDLGIVDPVDQGRDGFVARISGSDDLGDHRVIEGRDAAAFLNPGVDPQLLAKPQVFQRADRGQEPGSRVFGIEPRLDRPAVDFQLILTERQRFAAGHAQLPFDQIDPGDFLGHRVLDLKPRVHFHEPYTVSAQPFAGIGDEFDGACAFIVHRLGGAHCCGADRLAGGRVHAGGRGFLDHFLVAALERAVAFEQVDDLAVGIAEDLHFDMPGREDVLLDQDMVVAETGRRLALARGERIGKLGRVVHPPHPLAAAARNRLDQDRIANFGRTLGQKGRVLVFAQIARRGRHPGGLHQLLGGVLQAHGLDAGRPGADPDQPGIQHGLGKGGVFGKEAIARMDRLCPGGLGRGNDPVAHQIAFACRAGADMHGLIRQPHVQRLRIGIGIDRHRANAHLPRGADDPASDFAAIGD